MTIIIDEFVFQVLKGKHQFLEFAGNLVPVTKSGDQLSLYFLPFQENRLAFMVKVRRFTSPVVACQKTILMSVSITDS